RNPVDRDLRADEGPQPRLAAADPPAGLIGRDHGTGPHARGQRLVGGLHTAGGPGHRLDDPTGSDRDAELAEQRRDPAGRHPQPPAPPARQRPRPRGPSGPPPCPAAPPNPWPSQAATATARGPSWAPAAPSASEVCAGWRGCTRRPHTPHAPTRAAKRGNRGPGGGR